MIGILGRMRDPCQDDDVENDPFLHKRFIKVRTVTCLDKGIGSGPLIEAKKNSTIVWSVLSCDDWNERCSGTLLHRHTKEHHFLSRGAEKYLFVVLRAP